MAEYLVNEIDLSNVATAIRQKTGGANLISFPDEYISGIESLTNTNDANATAADILANKTAYAKGQKLYGSLPNKGEANIELTDLTTKTVERGYYSGGTAKIADAESAKIIPENIKSGVTVLGVEGTLESGPSASYSESVNGGGGLTATITM
jgi:hypothetical protein